MERMTFEEDNIIPYYQEVVVSSMLEINNSNNQVILLQPMPEKKELGEDGLLYLSGDEVFFFNGKEDSFVDLSSTFYCVKGNDARSIAFDICTTDNRDNVPIIGTGSISYFGAFQIMYNKQGIIKLTSYNADYSNSIGKKINDGIWHSVVVTYDKATLRIYEDGLLDNESIKWNVQSEALMESTMNTQRNEIVLGKSLWSNQNITLKGKMRNVKFYGKEVSKIAISVSKVL